MHIRKLLSRFSKNSEENDTLVSTVGKVNLDRENWRQSNCLYLKFQKLYKCKHFMGIALREKIISVPTNLVSTFLQKTKGPGAPKKAKGGRCLIVE